MTGRRITSPRRRRCLAFAVLATIGLLGSACESDQDPGLDTGGDGPATTSVTLGACPPGGPDDTTPPAGCLDEDGRVARP